jgi:hypothetical protein
MNPLELNSLFFTMNYDINIRPPKKQQIITKSSRNIINYAVEVATRWATF